MIQKRCNNCGCIEPCQDLESSEFDNYCTNWTPKELNDGGEMKIYKCPICNLIKEKCCCRCRPNSKII